MDSGAKWEQDIEKHIEECSAFIVVMSDNAKSSDWVRREVLHAIDTSRKIFPLLLQGRLLMSLQDRNYVDVTDGSLPNEKYFQDLAFVVPRNKAWELAEKERIARENAEKTRKEKEERDRKEAEEKTRIIAEEKARKDKEDRERKEVEEKVRLAAEEKALKDKKEQDRKEAEGKARIVAKEKAQNAKAERDHIAQQKAEKRKKVLADTLSKINLKKFITVGGIIGAVYILFFVGKSIFESLPAFPASTETLTIPTVTSTLQATVTLPIEITPSETRNPFTNTPEVTPTATLPNEITDQKGIRMNLVPAGAFAMGSNVGGSDERPVQDVYLSDYYIDIYEITNAAYKICVDDKKCELPRYNTKYDNLTYAQHPVVYINWNKARAYCEWRGARLPTEAEWEKAARGTDGRTYPWGEDISCDKANYGKCVGDTTKVGTYENGKSPYGIYDMAGNVWEQVSSAYEPYPYNASDGRENMGPVDYRVLRSGAWDSLVDGVRAALRSRYAPSSNYYIVGFRCAKSP